jgi:hypothetical protein
MKFLMLLSLYSSLAMAGQCRKAPIRIAVIDSGFGYLGKGHSAHLCKYGHKDFSFDAQYSVSYDTKVPVPLDTNDHGTNIVGIIDRYAAEAKINYCIVVIKYFSDRQTGQQNLDASIASIRYATNLKVDYINYSGGGENFSSMEATAVIKYLDQGGQLIAAAGNENSSLDMSGYYPAMYDKRIIIVGNHTAHGVRSELSNYGSPVKRWEVGEHVNAYGIVKTGTSQATAVATGKIVSESKCDIRN